jgi:hypothetical protein
MVVPSSSPSVAPAPAEGKIVGRLWLRGGEEEEDVADANMETRCASGIPGTLMGDDSGIGWVDDVITRE